ncbi:unnamed protein product [Adineta ricciae]|uniref:Gametogenetin-binding protein 2 n=1 Tax=Adineta ricciae TaxID=249248 RepID=A0A814RML9_ADIRI|nr:unnamed protein product [Adineta ricciae]
MSSPKLSIRLVAVCQKEQINSFDKRQIPINIDENLVMKLQIDDLCLQCDQQSWKNTTKTYSAFLQEYQKLTQEELHEALCVSIGQIKEYIRHCVPCVGCRTSIENFMKSLIEHHHPGLEPLHVNEQGLITIKSMYTSDSKNIYTLFHVHGSKLKSIVENIPKSKKNRRCNIHLLDKARSVNDWEIVWDMMNDECREEITLVETECLLSILENYLCKHKFCMECKLKVLEAYDLLMGDVDYRQKETKGFCPALYEGLRSCANEKHIHVDPKRDLLSHLISRAESEIYDSLRERHAKTLDIAQEEILTCIGIYLYERFDKIYRALRSEEQTWQLLFYITIDCLRLNFEKAVDRTQDLQTTLKNLCEELCEPEEIKTQKKQSKRSKRKSRREIKIDQDKPHEQKVNLEPTDCYCSCTCHKCLQRSNSFLMASTDVPSIPLGKSQSCVFSLLPEASARLESVDTPEQNLPVSSSLETVFSSISTRECVCNERLANGLCNEIPIVVCSRCSSARTDLGYSSGTSKETTSNFNDRVCSSILGQDDAFSLSPYEKDDSDTSTSSDHSILSSSSCSDTLSNHEKLIELCDTNGTCKLKLQLCDEYPFFHMDLKQTWDDISQLNVENEVYISDADLSQFFLLNPNFDSKRRQLGEILENNFQRWRQRSPYKN